MTYYEELIEKEKEKRKIKAKRWLEKYNLPGLDMEKLDAQMDEIWRRKKEQYERAYNRYWNRVRKQEERRRRGEIR